VWCRPGGLSAPWLPCTDQVPGREISLLLTTPVIALCYVLCESEDRYRERELNIFISPDPSFRLDDCKERAAITVAATLAQPTGCILVASHIAWILVPPAAANHKSFGNSISPLSLATFRLSRLSLSPSEVLIYIIPFRAIFTHLPKPSAFHSPVPAFQPEVLLAPLKHYDL